MRLDNTHAAVNRRRGLHTEHACYAASLVEQHRRRRRDIQTIGHARIGSAIGVICAALARPAEAPRLSLPSTIAEPRRNWPPRSRSGHQRGRRRIGNPRPSSQSRVASDAAAQTGTVKIVPRLARIALGLYKSVPPSATIRADTPAASRSQHGADIPRLLNPFQDGHQADPLAIGGKIVERVPRRVRHRQHSFRPIAKGEFFKDGRRHAAFTASARSPVSRAGHGTRRYGRAIRRQTLLRVQGRPPAPAGSRALRRSKSPLLAPLPTSRSLAASFTR